MAEDNIYNTYTEGFSTDIIIHVVSILNQGRSFRSNFEYSFKIGIEYVSVNYDHEASCLIIDVKKNDDNLIIKQYSDSTEFVVIKNGQTMTALAKSGNGILKLKKWKNII